MLAIRAILTTLSVVIAALCVTLLVIAADWLIGNFNIDRLIAVIGALVGVAGLIFTLVTYFSRRR